MTKKFAACLIAALTLAVSAVAIPVTAQAATVVKVSMTDQGTKVDPADGLGLSLGGDLAKRTMALIATPETVKAGSVTFEVVNDSKETIHEMIVAPVKDPSKPLPFKASDGIVDEEAMGDLGEVADVDPGKTGSLTVDLKPGTYILYCNIPTHYMTGMWTLITVTE